MTIRVELNPETEARLIAEARAQGLPVETIAERLLKEALTGSSLSRGQLGVEEFHRMLAAISEGAERVCVATLERAIILRPSAWLAPR
jgi:hypothetical protein